MNIFMTDVHGLDKDDATQQLMMAKDNTKAENFDNSGATSLAKPKKFDPNADDIDAEDELLLAQYGNSVASANIDDEDDDEEVECYDDDDYVEVCAEDYDDVDSDGYIKEAQKEDPTITKEDEYMIGGEESYGVDAETTTNEVEETEDI